MKRTRIRKRSKKAPLTKAMDTLLRQAVLLRDGFRCVKCGAKAIPGRGHGLQAAHIRSKGAWPALRYELTNVITLCARCHLYWWHKDPVAAVAWLSQEFGADYVARLEYLCQTRSKPDRAGEKLMLEKYIAVRTPKNSENF